MAATSSSPTRASPDGATDPKGTISVIDLRKGVAEPIVDTVDFSSLDGSPPSVPAGAILQSGKQPSADFEPEYITVSKNSTTAWVSLQESRSPHRERTSGS